MKKVQIFRTLCIAAAFVFAANVSQAQLRQSIFLNGNLPVSSWASTNVTTLGGNPVVPLTPANAGKAASLGFGAGYRAQYLFDVGMGEVAPFVNVDVLWNTVSKSINDAYTQYNMSATTYFNVPAFVGVSYFYDDLFSNITLFAEAGIGADFFFMTAEGKKNQTPDMWYAYKPSVSVAGEFGLGAYFGRHVSAGIHYYILGKHAIDMTSKTADNHPVEQAYYTTPGNRPTRDLGSLMLRIGFHL